MAVVLVAAVCRIAVDQAEARQAVSWPAVRGTILEGPRQADGGAVCLRGLYFEAEGAYYGNLFEIKCDSEEAADQFVRDNKGNR